MQHSRRDVYTPKCLYDVTTAMLMSRPGTAIRRLPSSCRRASRWAAQRAPRYCSNASFFPAEAFNCNCSFSNTPKTMPSSLSM
eukprot:8342039-Pyramimonas_sp.AAC.1